MKKEKTIRIDTPVDTDNAGPEREAEARQERSAKDDSCRCKEASTMKPRELFRLMVGDLAFWKKANKK